jgi:DNA-binding Xre family transcriptional regulator
MVKVKSIRALMAQCDIATQRDLADLLGIAESQVSRMLSSRARWSWATLDEMCAILNCQPSDLLVYVKDEPAPLQSNT